MSGLDLRRFQLVGAVLDSAGLRLGRADVFGAVAGGARLDDPACDLAVAAAVASAVARVPAPTASAFVGEIGLTGVVRPVPGMGARLSAARAAGLRTVFVPEGAQGLEGLSLVPVRHVMQALTWAAARPASVPGPPALVFRRRGRVQRGRRGRKQPLTWAFDLRVRSPACYPTPSRPSLVGRL